MSRTSALISYAFEGHRIRVSTDEHGEAWFVVADACAALAESPLGWALAIQRELAALPGPRHRSVAPTDLLVAAAAIDAELPILHRDRDFEAIAEVTGQPQRWVGPRA